MDQPIIRIAGKLLIAEVQPVEGQGDGTTRDKTMKDAYMVVFKGVFSSQNLASIVAMSENHMVDVVIGDPEDELL